MIIVTIPAYNEEKTLPFVLDDITKGMKGYDYKILVLDDGSKDKTSDIAKKLGAIVISNRNNLGLAKTFQREIQECIKLKADIIVHTDADGQYYAKDIPRLVKEIEKGYDLVIGSRFKEGYPKHMPISKRIGNILFSKALTKLTKVPLTDTTTGFRAFTRDVAENIHFINSFTYTQEQLIKASMQRYKIGEIAITTRKTRESRLFKNPIEYAFKAWINILRIYRDYNPLGFFGKIGIYLIGLGFFFGLFLIYNVIKFGEIKHLPLALVTILIILVGIQVILFGFLADMKK